MGPIDKLRVSGDLGGALGVMRSTLADADAELVMVLGGHRELTRVRVWRGQVLVDWEPDEQAGDCLLRPELIDRLLALHAEASFHARRGELRVRAPGRVVAAVSAAHHELVGQLGGAERVELRARLTFGAETYAYEGGEETYSVLDAGRRLEVLKLSVRVSRRAAQPASPHTSPART